MFICTKDNAATKFLIKFYVHLNHSEIKMEFRDILEKLIYFVFRIAFE